MTPDRWAHAQRAVRDARSAMDAWEKGPSVVTSRALTDALKHAQTVVHALHQPPARPTDTDCPIHPNGPVDHAGVDSGEGRCLRCNQDRRRNQIAATRPPRPERRRLGGPFPRQRNTEDTP